LTATSARVPQKPGPNVEDIGKRITRIVGNPKCADFIKHLINGTATAKNPSEFTDALTGFGMIKSFIMEIPLKEPTGTVGAQFMGL
jgi:hypothetical protein